MTVTLADPAGADEQAAAMGCAPGAEPPSTMLDRIALILESFDGHPQQSLAAVTRRTGLPRSTTHRMLEHLVHMRWVRRDGRDYELGTRLIELGSLAADQSRLHAVAVPVLRELHRVTGLAVYLGVLDGGEVLYTQRFGVPGGRVVVKRVGSRMEVPRSPIGRAILASSGAPAPAGLSRAELAGVRDHGVAYVDSGLGRGIGAAIGGHDGPVAGLSICGRADALRLDHAAATPVRMAAAAITRALADGGVHVAPVLARRHPLRAMPTARPHAAPPPVRARA